uniref:Ribonuclease P protein subunit p20-like n=1 Tax=Geotrypetes seraphini TaxID=260995 RepID=A0A6P8QK25_GEOSA|nr:ribonuclease P protein subunit p20-like [Geotrypetes seraphini]
MNKIRNLTLEESVHVSVMSEEGFLCCQITSKVGCSHSAVVKIVQKKRATSSVVDKPQSGHLHVSTSCQDRTLQRISLTNCNLTSPQQICIHGLGLAINRAINVALQLQANSFGTLQIAANTSTVELVDDLEPEVDDEEPASRTRNNSAIHIKVYHLFSK